MGHLAHAPFTRLNSRTTYFRRKVPIDLKTQLGLTEICCHVGAVNTVAAVQVGRALAAVTDKLFMTARAEQMLNKADLKKLIADTVQHLRDHHRRDRDERSAVAKPTGIPIDVAPLT